MRAASKQCLELLKSITVATLICALIPFGGLQAQTTTQPDLHKEMAAASPGAAAYAEASAGAVGGVTLDGSVPVAGVLVVLSAAFALRLSTKLRRFRRLSLA